MEMTPENEVLKVLAKKKAYLKSKYGVRRLALFGSYARGRAGKGSDVDILVEFDRPVGFEFFDMCDDLEKALDKKVDVLTTAGLKSIRIGKVAKSIGEGAVYV